MGSQAWPYDVYNLPNQTAAFPSIYVGTHLALGGSPPTQHAAVDLAGVGGVLVLRHQGPDQLQPPQPHRALADHHHDRGGVYRGAHDLSDTKIQCWINGELRQDGLTSDLIFDIPTLIETCSRGITLYPGDLIATGTPAGVGMGLVPPRFLQSGDVVRVEIDGLGTIENRFV